MIFGFNVVSLFYIIKMHEMIQFYTFNESNGIFNKQNNLKKVDIFGLMARLNDPKVISLLSMVGHAFLDKDQSLDATLVYQLQDKNKHLEHIQIDNTQFKMVVSVEQASFINDNISLYKLSFESNGEHHSEFFTREAFFIDWISETIQEFDWLTINKTEKNSV